MELIEKLDIRLDDKGYRRRWAKFKCSFCLQEVERILYDGVKCKSCGCVHYKLISEANKGFKPTEETKNKIRLANTGKKRSMKVRQEMSEKRKGKKQTKTTIEKRSQKRKGLIPSEETKQKMRDNHANVNGKNNPNWQDGKSFEEYGTEFNKKVKQFILERDNYICQYSDCIEIHDRLHIHHIDYDKKNNKPKNLITLGTSCHTKTNYNRQYWTEYYQNIISKKGLIK